MKKIIAFTLVLVLALSLTACNIKFNGGNNTSGTPSGGNPTGTSGAAGATGTTKTNADGSLDLAIKSSEANGFVCTTKGVGSLMVNLPTGAIDGNKQLNVSRVTTTLDGIVDPGFNVTDKANPGQHVVLSQPATVTFYSKDALPSNVVIVKYSEDMKSYTPIPCYAVSTDKGYFIMGEVDSFSGVGLGDGGDALGSLAPDDPPPAKKPAAGEYQGSDGFIWRIEAENHTIRVKSAGAESTDMTVYIRADSMRFPPTTSNLAIPYTYTGLFDIASFAMSEQKANVGGNDFSVPAKAHMSDKNFKLTMFPNLKKDSAAWKKFYDDMFDWAMKELTAGGSTSSNDPLGALAPDDDALGSLAPDIPPPPKPPKDIFDGYIGSGVAHLTYEEFTALGISKAPDVVVDIPVTVATKDGVNVTVSFVFPGMGAVEVKGIFKGVGVATAAATASPVLHDPEKEYSPDKPFVAPPPVEGDPVGDLTEAAATINTKITLPNGGWISLISLWGGYDDKDKKLTDFQKLWSNYLNAKSAYSGN